MRPDFEEALELIPGAVAQDWRAAEARLAASADPVDTTFAEWSLRRRASSMQPAYRLQRALIRRLDGVFRDTACTLS